MLETVLQPLIDFVTATIGGYGLFTDFGLMHLASIGTLIPSEAISSFTGYLVPRRETIPFAAVAAGVLGNVVSS